VIIRAAFVDHASLHNAFHCVGVELGLVNYFCVEMQQVSIHINRQYISLEADRDAQSLTLFRIQQVKDCCSLGCIFPYLTRAEVITGAAAPYLTCAEVNAESAAYSWS
jgi:hypothetical protein